MDPETQGFAETITTVKPSPGDDPNADPHHAAAITTRALDFLSRHQTKPFLCVVEHHLVHKPEIAPPADFVRWAARPGSDHPFHRPALAAMTEALDREVGRLLAGLDALGLASRTLVVFSSDHGPPGPHDALKPSRGAKASLLEGGLRVPLLFRWPGRFPAGCHSSFPVCGADVFPTLLAAAGLPLPSGERDGVDLLPHLIGGPPPARDTLYWHFPHYHHQGIAPAGALRRGPWKLVEWFEQSILGPDTPGAFQLFDLAGDPTESRDLAPAQPARTAELRHELAAWRSRLGAQSMTLNPGFDPSRATLIGPPPPLPSTPSQFP